MNTKLLATVAVALLCLTAGCAGLVGDQDATPAAGDGTPTPNTDTPVNQVDATTEDQRGDIEGEFQSPSIQPVTGIDNYTDLYDETIDSVVEIRVETARGQGQGSGFVYHENGYVVTNQHVVSDAEAVSVGFASGVWRTGQVVGTDVYTDLAVVHVDSLPEAAEPLPLATRNPDPGQPVAAIGSPLGYQGSITQGIVSGTNRSMPVAGGFSIPDTVQTDAPINPGNSGGPLVSMDGAVVGVNRAKVGDNIGFAISADVVEEVVPAIVENGSYAHSYLGIRSVPVTPDVAEANGLERARGILVVDVLQGGPAAGALQVAERQRGPDGRAVPVGGDVIVGVENRSIPSQHDLARHLLLQTHSGEEITVTVLRDGQRVTETITLGQRPSAERGSGV